MEKKSYSLFLFLMLTGAQTQAEIILQTVGSVGDEIISSRDVQICYALEKVLYSTDQKVKEEDLPLQDAAKKKNTTRESSKSIKLDLKDKEFSSELSSCLLENIAQKEAQSFQVAQISTEDVQGAVDKVKKELATLQDWQKLQVTNEELKKFVEQKMVSKRFIKIKTDSMTAVITDQEAQMYFEKNRLKFGQMSFAQFKQNIKKFLQQQQLEERLKTLFETLKKKYRAKNYLSEGTTHK
jgi:hypothetical protein